MRMGLAALVAGAIALGASRGQAQTYLGAAAEYFNWHEQGGLTEQGLRMAFVFGAAGRAAPGEVLLAYRGRVYLGASAYAGELLFAPQTAASSVVGYLGTVQEGQIRYRADSVLDLLGALGLDLWRRQMSSQQGEDYRMLYASAGFEHLPAGVGWTYSARVNLPLWMQLRRPPHAGRIRSEPDPRAGSRAGCRVDPRIPVIPPVGAHRLLRFPRIQGIGAARRDVVRRAELLHDLAAGDADVRDRRALGIHTLRGGGGAGDTGGEA